MLKINKKVEYSLMVLKYLKDNASNDSNMSARILSTNLSIPFDSTSKVMQLLTTAGVLKASQGARGGYTIQSNLSEISYYKLVQIIEGKHAPFNCITKNCNLADKCNIQAPITNLSKKLDSFFTNITLDQLLAN